MRKRKVKLKKKMVREKIYLYTAVFEPAVEGGFNVTFPALPGCFTFGKDLPDARRMAKDVLELWIEELLARKKKVPLREVKPVIQKIKVAVGPR